MLAPVSMVGSLSFDTCSIRAVVSTESAPRDDGSSQANALKHYEGSFCVLNPGCTDRQK
jgi:hypothetical protein